MASRRHCCREHEEMQLTQPVPSWAAQGSSCQGSGLPCVEGCPLWGATHGGWHGWAVTSRRLQQCSSVQLGHWCGSWHYIWGSCCTAIILPQAFCTWNSQTFSWCWTKNILVVYNCRPSPASIYPRAGMVKHPEESITWSLGSYSDELCLLKKSFICLAYLCL